MTPLVTACTYIGRGWWPVPIPYRQKRPREGDWQKLRIGREEAPRYFNSGPQNIGVILGLVSGGLADVDVDCSQALRVAHLMLPPTGRIFGRPGKRRSHYLYTAGTVDVETGQVTPEHCGTTQFKDPTDDAMLVELRGDAREDGSQTVFPGSTHESGEPIDWHEDDGQAVVRPAALRRSVAELAAVALIARHWPPGRHREKDGSEVGGGRNSANLKLAGWLTRADWGEDRVAIFLERVAAAAGAEANRQKRKVTAADAAKRTREDAKLYGWTALAELLGEKVVAKAAEWLQIERQRLEAAELPWPEPKPLPSGLPPVEPFDLRLLPKRLRPWVQDIADRMQCPPDFVAVPTIVALGSVIGRQLGIRPKRKDDWLVVPNLWGGVVGRPGLLKTPALQEAIRPLMRLEVEAKTRHEEKLKLHEAEKKLGVAEKKLQEKELQARLKKGTGRDILLAELMEGAHERDAPARRRYLVNDSTVEKLGEILAVNPNGVLVFRDELTGWLSGLERDGREGDRAFYLESWNGTNGFTYDRIGRGTVDIEAACLSLLGGIQPGPLAAYLGAIKAGGIADDGLMQRFQLVVWPDPSPEWKNVDEWPDAEAKQVAFDSFVSASALVPSDFSAEQPEGAGIPFLRFEHDAQVEFDQWRHGLELRLRAGNLHTAFEAHLAKFRSLVPSLALIFHVVEGAGGAVSHMACARAITFSKYLESHARRLYDLLLRSDAAAGRALGEHILTGELGDTFTARDVYRREWAELGDRETVVAALELLEDLDWIRSEATTPGPKGGRSRTEYRVNPRLRETPP